VCDAPRIQLRTGRHRGLTFFCIIVPAALLGAVAYLAVTGFPPHRILRLERSLLPEDQPAAVVPQVPDPEPPADPPQPVDRAEGVESGQFAEETAATAKAEDRAAKRLALARSLLAKGERRLAENWLRRTLNETPLAAAAGEAADLLAEMGPARQASWRGD
jgi:hypothetical protein